MGNRSSTSVVDTPASQPPRKRPCLGSAGSPSHSASPNDSALDSLLKRLQGAVRDLTSVQAKAFDKDEQQLVSSAGWELLAFAREIEKANLPPARPEPEQTPLPTDELVLVLSAVPAVDLARWASVSRHWKAVVAEVVRQRFKRLADLGTKGTFTKRHDERYDTKLLARERVPSLLERIDPDAPFDATLKRQLDKIHKEVIYLRMGLIFQKLGSLQEASSDDFTPAFQWRFELMRQLIHYDCKPPAAELAQYAEDLIAEMDGMNYGAALMLFKDLSAEEIEKRLEILVTKMPSDFRGATYTLLQVIMKASLEAIAPYAEAIKSAARLVLASEKADHDEVECAEKALAWLA